MLQFHPIKIASGFNAKDWRSKIEPGQTFYSWVMNNHWETNYKADQEGVITFKYVIAPHDGGYDSVKSQKIGRSVCQGLIVTAADPAKPVIQPMLKVNGDGVVVTSIRPSRNGKGIMVRLFNISGQQQNTSLKWSVEPEGMWLSNPMEEKLSSLTGPIQMVPHEIVTLRIEML
jgi:alpha-mannosidase